MSRADRPLLYICSAGSDREWVRGEVLPRLGLVEDHVRMDLDFQPGSRRLSEIERAVEECRFTVVVISAETRREPLLGYAKELALHAGVEAGEPRVIVLTRDASPKLTLAERSLVGLDCSDEECTTASLARLRELLGLEEPVVTRPPCPYPGLRSFEATNRSLMFGRDHDSEELVRRIRNCHPRILLVGPSGSGKSSLIRAAVLPALPGDDYLVEVIAEDSDPNSALRASAARLQIDRLPTILDDYVTASADAAGPEVEHARTRFDAIVVPDPRRRILVVDPLEPIFIDHDKAKRRRFFHALGALWSQPWCTVILCMRSDFEGSLRLEPCWRELEGSGYSLPHLSEAGLRAAIVEPARRVEVYIEPALVERLIREVDPDRSSAALPTLQVALEELWERLKHRYLTLESYESIVGAQTVLPHAAAGSYGNNARQQARGLTVVLSVHADRVLQKLSTADREIARQILLDLVRFGEGRPHTRRQRTLEQLRRRGNNAGDVERVLEALVKGRLITTTGAVGHTAGPTGHFHLAHDALIEGWTMLATLVKTHQVKMSGDRQLEEYKQHRGQDQGRYVPRWAIPAGIMVVASVTVGAITCRPPQPAMTECEHAVSTGELETGLATCLGRNHAEDPGDLVWASEAYIALDSADEARKLGRQLIGGPRDADGHRILSEVILHAEPANSARARSEAAVAFAAYLRSGDLRGLVRGAITLSRVSLKQRDVNAALDAADQALAVAEHLEDGHTQVAAHLVRADALQGAGDLLGAREELGRAHSLAATACDKTSTYVNEGMHEAASDRHEAAMRALRIADAASKDCHRADVARLINIMTAWLTRRTDPRGALERLDRAESRETTPMSLLVRAEVAATLGSLADSERYLAQADAAPVDPAWVWNVEYARAELAELRGGPDGDHLAERFYRRAIARIAGRAECGFTRAARFVASPRSPFLGLMALYARTGRLQELLGTLLELDASDPVAPRSTDVLACGPPAELDPRQEIREAPALSAAGARVLAAWRSRDLVIVFAAPPRQIGPGERPMYRLHISEGRLAIDDVGDANAATQSAEALVANPRNREAARALGRVIVPPGSSEAVLDVLALGPLTRVPLGALRDEDGALTISRRPLARVLALQPGSERIHHGDQSVILVDPRDDLPGAASEGEIVATAAVARAKHFRGADATLARLWEARDADLLHVAVHTTRRGGWSALELADGSITPPEIVKGGLAPRLAVLTASHSAISDDGDHRGSLAAAFLEAGTAAVIATEGILSDDESAHFVAGFYQQPDWRTDPVRALARAQHAAAMREPDDAAAPWASFIAFRRPPDERKGELE
ncbi:MAG TPA: CHAT domain-containing protein [Kofleriaceae bacterium]|nr:CHAT domain-containing protein [Kofleriaceae bacterium]